MFKGVRWKPLAVFATVIASIVILYLVCSKARYRKEFVGKVNDKGYRCRFSLSPDWKRDAKLSRTQGGSGDDDFFDLPLNPFWQWINGHILRRTPAATSSTNCLDATANSFQGNWYLVEGYPEHEKWWGADTQVHHLKIDGYPATFIVTKGTWEGKPFRHEALLVYASNQGPLYEVSILADQSYFDKQGREMQAIISSFHVEKVASPKSGKR